MNAKKRSFPYYVLVLLALLALLAALLLRFAGGALFSRDPAEIVVTAEGQQLTWVVAKNQWHGSQYDREPTFVLYQRSGLLPSQVSGGTSVSITMNGTLPDQVILGEYALTANESSVYGQADLLEEHAFYFDGRTGSFPLPQAADAPVRGYLLTCSWGGNTCEYAFVVQLLP